MRTPGRPPSPASSGLNGRNDEQAPWLLLPFPRVLLVAPDAGSRAQLERLLPDRVRVVGRRPDEGLGASKSARPDVVLVFGADHHQLEVSLASVHAGQGDSPLVIVLAETPELESDALASEAEEVLFAGRSAALNRRRVARILDGLACRRRDQLARQLVESLECGIVVADAARSDYPVLHVNGAWERISGCERNAVLGRSAGFLQSRTTDPALADELRSLAASTEGGRIVVRNSAGGGVATSDELRILPLRNPARRVTHFVGVRHDVTDRQKVAELERSREDLESLVRLRTRSLEAALAALEARGLFVETVLDAMTAGVLAVDASSAVTLANRAALEILEVSREACVGVPVVNLLQSPPEVLEALATLPPGTERRVEVSYVTPSGRTIELGLSVVATRTSSVVGRPGFWTPPGSAPEPGRIGGIEIDRPLSYLLLFRDLGLQRQFEVELRRVNALTAVGQMAAGFAHEIRNPLAAIRSLSDNLLTELPEGDDRREYATRIVSLTRRLERFVRSSLRFAQPREPAPRPCSPLGLAEDALEVLSTRFKTGPVLRALRADPAAPKVFVDPDQIAEVLVALLDNALDVVAAPDHVRVLVEIAGPADGVEEGAFVAVEVADDGPGIPPELQARVFDPFFTTKPKGTGLGLSIVQRIVRNNRGHLRLVSRPGETRFRILLPAAEP